MVEKSAGAAEHEAKKEARRARVDVNAAADRKPLFKLIPSMGELAKLEAKSKARQRGMAMRKASNEKHAADASKRFQGAGASSLEDFESFAAARDVKRMETLQRMDSNATFDTETSVRMREENE